MPYRLSKESTIAELPDLVILPSLVILHKRVHSFTKCTLSIINFYLTILYSRKALETSLITKNLKNLAILFPINLLFSY